jgi:hypothetical protein
MLRFDLWLLYTFLDKDNEMYTRSCFHLIILFRVLDLDLELSFDRLSW